MKNNNFHPVLRPTADYISSNFTKNSTAIDVDQPKLFNINVSSKTIDRTLEILNSIITKISSPEIIFSVVNDDLCILCKDNHKYKLSICERTRKLWRAPTKTAFDKSKDYIENRGKIRVANSSVNKKYDEYYTGHLCLDFRMEKLFVNKKWQDTAKNILEKRIDEIIADIDSIIRGEQEKEIQRKINIKKEFNVLRNYLASKDEISKIEEREKYLRSLIKRIQELHQLKSWHQSVAATENFENYSNFNKFLDWSNTKIQDMENALSPKSIEAELEWLEIMKDTNPLSVKDENIYQLVIDYLDQESGEAPLMDWPEHIKASVERLEHLMTFEEMDNHIFGKS